MHRNAAINNNDNNYYITLTSKISSIHTPWHALEETNIVKMVPIVPSRFPMSFVKGWVVKNLLFEKIVMALEGERFVLGGCPSHHLLYS